MCLGLVRVVWLANPNRDFELALGYDEKERVVHVLRDNLAAFVALGHLELVDRRPNQGFRPVLKQYDAAQEYNLVVAELVDHSPQVQIVVLARHDQEDAVVGTLYRSRAQTRAVVDCRFSEDFAFFLASDFLHDEHAYFLFFLSVCLRSASRIDLMALTRRVLGAVRLLDRCLLDHHFTYIDSVAGLLGALRVIRKMASVLRAAVFGRVDCLHPFALVKRQILSHEAARVLGQVATR